MKVLIEFGERSMTFEDVSLITKDDYFLLLTFGTKLVSAFPLRSINAYHILEFQND